MEVIAMRTVKLLAVAVAGLASIPLMAQQVNATAQQGASGSAAGMHVNQSADANTNANVRHSHAEANSAAEGSIDAKSRHGSANANTWGSAAGSAAMRPVTGELMGKLDSKSARVGEPVILRTTQKMKTADGFEIPRGSRLIGRVTEVQAHTKGHEQSSLGIAFDRAELKNGESFAIHSLIESVGPNPAELEAASMESEGAFAGPAGGGMAGGVSSMGGGGVGVGRAGGATSAVGHMGSIGSDMTSTAGGAMNAGGQTLNATGNLAGSAAAHVGRGIAGSAGTVGSLGEHATAFPGVMLEGTAAGDESGKFTAAKKNIHFDSGTQMVLGVVASR
jgi:hypothetical protein